MVVILGLDPRIPLSGRFAFPMDPRLKAEGDTVVYWTSRA
jgi:hypothetical protein